MGLITDSALKIGNTELKSRFFIGTGKFKNKAELQEAIIQSESQVVTVAVRRIDINKNEDNILSYIPEDIILMPNTSGARDATEAIRIAMLAREAGYGNWVKIEIMKDSKYLLPDNNETIKATEALAKEGFVVMPYMHPDIYAARALVDAGAAAVMPLGSLIGSNQGLETKMMIKVLIDEINIPIVVDAGIGAPSQASFAMEMGADAVLVNTAVATSENPIAMSVAFSKAVEAGRLAYLAKLAEEKTEAAASSPLTGFLYN